MKAILATTCLLLGLSIPAFVQSDSAKTNDGEKSVDNAKTADKAPPQKVDYKIIYGYRTHYVEPIYPPLARRAKIQGDVVLHAIIDTTGKVTRLKVLSGHPVLAVSALDAVKQWKYRPYLLEGKVVPVDTTITVSFHL
jgi:protein TonB